MSSSERDIELDAVGIEYADEEPLSVLKLHEERERLRKELYTEHYARAELNERYINGDQFIQMTETYDIEPAQWFGDDVKVMRNLMPNLGLTWTARMLEDRPRARPYPATAGVDVAKAEIATKVLAYQEQQHDLDALLFRAGMLVQPHSDVCLKPVWDPLRGALDDVGYLLKQDGTPLQEGEPEELAAIDELGQPMRAGVGKPVGDVLWELVPTFRYWTDGAEQIEDAEAISFDGHISKWDARRLLLARGYNEWPREESYETRAGVSKKGVVVVEHWFRPSPRLPVGLYAVVVGGVAVKAQAFPYKHGELPACIWKCGELADLPWGTTHVDNARPIQRAINEDVSALQQQIRLIGSIKALMPSSLKEQYEHGHQILTCDDPKLAEIARYLEPPDRVKAIKDNLAENTEALYAVYGLNAMLTGAENVNGGTAARSIAYVNKLDRDKQSGAARSLHKALVRLTRQTLELYKQYVRAPRLVQIAGPQNTLEVAEFRGADFHGLDVRLEPSAGLDMLSAARAGDAQQAMQQQGPTPDLMEVANTGLPETVDQARQRQALQMQMQATLQGQPAAPDPSIDPQVAVDEIGRLLPSYPALAPLFAAYQQAAAARAQASQASQGLGPGPHGGMSPGA